MFFFLSLQTLTKRKFLCTSDYDEGYFDFHCLPGGKSPSDGMEFYTACGTPFPNHVEYIVVIAGICWIAFLIFVNLHFRSGTETVYGSTTVSSKSQQSNPKKRALKKENWKLMWSNVPDHSQGSFSWEYKERFHLIWTSLFNLFAGLWSWELFVYNLLWLVIIERIFFKGQACSSKSSCWFKNVCLATYFFATSKSQ